MSSEVGASSGSISRDAKIESTSRLKLISPSPIVTGIIRTKTRLTAGSRQSIRNCSRPSSPRSQGTGSRTWITVPITIEMA